ncbi:MAG: aspartate dehydrogenase [Ruminococcus sp.]|nr:aspartate dehydrogenase [Ruminococcus sp.]
MKHKLSDFFSARSSRFEVEPYNPEKQYAVVRASICTGEKVAGFKNKDDGRFTEVMLIKTPKDEQKFKEIYKVDTIKHEY